MHIFFLFLVWFVSIKIRMNFLLVFIMFAELGRHLQSLLLAKLNEISKENHFYKQNNAKDFILSVFLYGAEC